MNVVAAFKRDCESSDDLKLGLLELQALAGAIPESVTLNEAAEFLGMKHELSDLRGRLLYAVSTKRPRVEQMVRRLAFWELIACCSDELDVTNGLGTTLHAPRLTRNGISVLATQSQVLEWTAYSKESPDLNAALLNGHSFEGLVSLGGPGVEAAIRAPLTPASRRKNEYLTHGFHKYKAKFFPRLARSLINYTNPGATGVVLDPYCGSGTTGVEAALLGLDAWQFDIDPLSVFISRMKSRLERYNASAIEGLISRCLRQKKSLSPGLFAGPGYRLPAFLLERKPKRLTADEVEAIQRETSALQELIQVSAPREARDLLELALSHALSTKISLRWMGTGDNRYALEVAKRSIQQIFIDRLIYMQTKLRTVEALQQGDFLPALGHVDSLVSNCTQLPLPAESVDSIITSPPYLPAASGRETYLRSRAASLVALGLLSEAEIFEYEKEIVGSVLATPTDKPNLPRMVTELVQWMLPQRERTAKAKPTLAYFEKLGASLREMRRVLRPGGLVALVVSKEHTFWELTTKKVLRKFDMVEAICELATTPAFGVGFEIERVETIELSKMDFAARPGAQGAYFEAIIFFRKPKP